MLDVSSLNRGSKALICGRIPTDVDGTRIFPMAVSFDFHWSESNRLYGFMNEYQGSRIYSYECKFKSNAVIRIPL